jgi:hypothetical protein
VTCDATERTRLLGDLGGVHCFDGKTSGVKRRLDRPVQRPAARHIAVA